MATKKKSKRFVVITTDADRGGVFSGELVLHDRARDIAVLDNARMAVYWSADVHGVTGLAAGGPTQGCRISPRIPKVEINGVTAVMDMTPESVAAWEAEPWGTE